MRWKLASTSSTWTPPRQSESSGFARAILTKRSTTPSSTCCEGDSASNPIATGLLRFIEIRISDLDQPDRLGHLTQEFAYSERNGDRELLALEIEGLIRDQAADLFPELWHT